MLLKLGIIATDIEMKKTIEALYPKETGSGDYMIEILDKDHIDQQGKRLEAKGARVIIGRSGSYERSVGNVSVPLLRLQVTSFDIFNALIKGAKIGNKLSLIIWEGIHFDIELLNFVPGDVDVYTFSNGDEIETVYRQVIANDPGCVIIGGGIVCSYARRDGLPSVFINAAEESIIEVVDYAKEIMKHLDRNDYQNELLTRTVHSVRDAVVVIDENEEVQLFNQRAENILKIGMGRVIGKKLQQVLPKLGFLAEDLNLQRETKEELLWIGSLVISYSTSLIWADNKIKGMLLTFQDTTRLQMLEQKIRRKLNKKGLIAKYNFEDIVTEDPLMGEMLRKAKKIGDNDSTVVIYGESGTGKEVLAQSLHNACYRSQAPFVAVNCAALSEALLESELFGYEEGAFTGARKGGKPGLFELAHGGTIFLDEINSISLGLQGKLLRVIEEKEVMRLGSDYIIPLDVRIICAANEDLKTLTKQKAFRDDLFYRLSSLEIVVPPLRERQADIEPLFIHFIRELKKDEEIRWPSGQEIDKLKAHDWPGNVRELRNIAERYVLFDEIDLVERDNSMGPRNMDSSIDLKEIHQMVEEKIIAQLLKSGLSKVEIAEKLGISRATLWNKLKK